MPNYTENYNLEKPLANEYYNIDVFNSNADILDGEMKKMSDSMNELQKGLDFDDMPTEGSSNPVTSDGIFQAVKSVSIETDATLTGSGSAADAKAAGDRITALETAVGNVAALLASI